MSREKANEQINSQFSSSGEKQSHRKLIIAVILVVCILVGVILYLLFGRDSEPEPKDEPVKINQVVTPDNIDEVLAQLAAADKTPMGNYEVTMTSDWKFKNGDAASSNAYVENSKRNQNTVYFTITRVDNGKTIYKSPYIPIGSSLENIKLDTTLDAGKYDTVMTYHLVDEENQEKSTVSVSLAITIEQ